MTTIAYRNGTIAADTQAENCGWVMPARAKKIRRINDDTVAAICGDWALFEPWLHWRRVGDSVPFDLGESTRIILVNAAEGVTIYEGKGWFKFEAPFGAWGSGWPAAVAAMYMGADAKKAVQVAALLDPSTGEDVQAVEVSSALVGLDEDPRHRAIEDVAQELDAWWGHLITPECLRAVRALKETKP